jgi:hypothetical protein
MRKKEHRNLAVLHPPGRADALALLAGLSADEDGPGTAAAIEELTCGEA